MKKIAFLIFVFFLAVPGFSVELKNEDSATYDIKIHQGTTTYSSIGGSTTQLSICSECEIEVVGIGSIKASGSEVVVIKDGQLSKR